jgi:hypothetical protein
MKRGDKSTLPGFPWKGQFKTKEEINEYFSNSDGIQCLLCGRILTTLGRHLRLTHECSLEEYRGRYGLPWRKGLVSGKLSKGFSSNLTRRIKNGSFKPPADTTAAVDRIRAGGRRKDQPFFTAFKAERATKLNKKNIRYHRKDYEKVLAVMLKNKIPPQKACMDKNLPAPSSVFGYAESNPDFRNKLLDTYYALPYDIQARSGRLSPQFYEDLKKLEAENLSITQIGKKLGVSFDIVKNHIKQIRTDNGRKT